MTLAIIGGTGLEELASSLTNRTDEIVENAYGKAFLMSGDINGSRVVFLARHGLDHDTAPHLINYRANIMALKEAGATHILASAAVGSLKQELKPGDLVLIDQFIDFTKNRASTFSDFGKPIYHIDMTEPYDGNLRRLVLQAAGESGVEIRPGGTYVCTEGPRFETAAEINMFRMMGADVVGMTSVPEVVLAAEMEIPYAALCVVTNFAAGMPGYGLAFDEHAREMGKRQTVILETFLKAAKTGKII